jgi:glutamate carboxypeptidase
MGAMPRPASRSLGQLHTFLLAESGAMQDALGRYVSEESGSFDVAGVDRAGHLVSEALRALGFDVARTHRRPSGDHLIARRRGGGQGRLLLLIHLDTVWPTGTLIENPFRIVDGRAYGPGVLDMKGGWVVMLWALRALSAAGWDGLAEVAVFMCGDEELGSPTGRPLIEEEARRADYVLVMEPARENGDVVVRRGMVGAVTLEVRGVTAHATAEGRGASAIHALVAKVVRLQALSDRRRGVLVNVGTVRGGSARQVIPDRATASIDVRAPTPDLADDVMARIREIAGAQDVPGTRAVLSGGITRPAFERTAGTARLLHLAQSQGRQLEMSFGGAETMSGSDGNFTAALGIPTLDGLGPVGAHSCSLAEYVAVASLPLRAALLAGIIAGLPSLLGQGAP